MGPRRPNPYWRSRVTPGTSATIASRVRVNRLNSVDLPTLGRPTSATMGSTKYSWSRASLRGRRLGGRRCGGLGHRGSILRFHRLRFFGNLFVLFGGRAHAERRDTPRIVDDEQQVPNDQRWIADPI